jgi:uncharacterized membrane protein YdjX (TVP38/TMEM64 family)
MKEKPLRLARFAPLALIVLALSLALVFRVHEQLSLDVLRARREQLDAFVAVNLAAALALYALAYVAAVAVSLPGATILTLTGGFLFGPWLGGSATVIAATMGATGVFLAARTALADSLRGRAGGWLERLREGFARNAFNYLLVLRLTPIAPFFIVNLAPAFLGVTLRDYFFATLIGIIPGTFVYASVGASLRAAFEAGTAADPAQAARALLFSPAVVLPVLGLAALSLLPVLIKMLRREKPA